MQPSSFISKFPCLLCAPSSYKGIPGRTRPVWYIVHEKMNKSCKHIAIVQEMEVMTTSALPKVGDTIEVYWPDDKTYYAGRVAAFDKTYCRHRLEYYDGDVESLSLNEERWRTVPQSAPKAVTTQHLGAILRNAAHETPRKRLRKIICKRKGIGPISPVSIIQETLHGGLADLHDCGRPTSARFLIAHIATNWLRDETRRPSTPVTAPFHSIWVKMCSDICIRYVYDWLAAIETDCAAAVEDVCDANSEVSWMQNVCSRSVKLAQKNYCKWKRPLSLDEWAIEIDIMHSVAEHFTRTGFQLTSSPKRTSLAAARSNAAIALQR